MEKSNYYSNNNRRKYNSREGFSFRVLLTEQVYIAFVIEHEVVSANLCFYENLWKNF